jgi:hypothetical protein
MTPSTPTPVKLAPCYVPAFGHGYKLERLDGQAGFRNWYATATGAASEARQRGYDLQFANRAEIALARGFWIKDIIAEAIEAGQSIVMTGNAKDGWCAVIIGGDDEYDLQCSPLFLAECGDTRADALDAFNRAYGFEIKPSRHVANCRL